MPSRELITTRDGSHSLLHTTLNETYHSVHGAVQESRHVFIANGLDHWFSLHPDRNPDIFEVGFGTGLNALLTLDRALELQVKINYATIEAFPIARELWSVLNYADSPARMGRFIALHEASWDLDHDLYPLFKFHKYYKTLESITLLPEAFDVIYYDAFAPAKQPEMWTFDLLEKVVHALRPEGCFITYCAKGQLKRDLRALNLTVETLPGPPGKKEMVRATKA